MPVTRDFLIEHFGDLWPVHTRGFTALLIECRRHFEGDIDQLLILSVIGERTLHGDRAQGVTYHQFLQGDRIAGIPARINTQSVADSTGIPRETVRRKIERLIGRGWIRKNDDGTLEVTETAAVELAPATQATFDYILAIHNALAAKAGGEHPDA